MKRREFLTKSAALLAISQFDHLLRLNQAFAVEANSGLPHFFVQIALRGGWDITLGTDPWLANRPDEKEMFIEYNPNDIKRVGNIPFGPSLIPLEKYADRLCLVNGIFLSANDNGHEAATTYMQSGSTNQNWGSLSTEILQCRDGGPFGIATDFSGTSLGGRSEVLTRLSNLYSLENQSIESFLSSQNIHNHLSQVENELINIKSKVLLFKDVAAKIRKDSNLSSLTDKHYLAALFASQLCKVGALSVFQNLDTHSAHVGNHINILSSSFKEVAELLDVFASVEFENTGASLLDRTTFFITSEFSRTAALNSSGGKDHNPLVNSAILLGPKIKGNQVIGGSHLVETKKSKTGSSYHIASAIDEATGLPVNTKNGGLIIKPENVAATLVESLDISRRRFASVDFGVKSLSKLALK